VARRRGRPVPDGEETRRGPHVRPVRVAQTSTPGERLLQGSLLTVKIRQPSHEFTFGVGMSFIPYPLVLTPVV
jgi:hypothetical protein